MKIATRLWLLCGVFVLVLVGIAGYGLMTSRAASGNMQSLYADRVVPLRQIKVVSDMYAVNIVDAAHKFRDGIFTRDAALKSIDDARKTIDAEWSAYLATQLVPEETALVAELEPLKVRMDGAVQQFRAMVAANDVDAVRVFAAGPLYPTVDPMQDVIGRLMGVQLDVSRQVYEASAAAGERQLVVSLGMTVAACVVAGLMVGWISRRIHRELGGEPHEVRSVANDVAAGDLTEHFTVPASDQDSVMASMARMRNNLSGIVRSVRESADQLVRASSEIAQGNHDLSQRTEEQASALEQTAASMEQIGSTVQSNATHAQEAHALAQSATEVAERSEQAVRDVVRTMQGIDQGSRRIADITSVIDGIAFQTNILALNAAVEAARAGEQGRGFAVVAGEVRTLAQRSAEAAREIRQLIGGSVDQVAQGVALVHSSGETIHQAVTSIHQLGQLIADIAHASREQNDGVGQVVTAVSQLDQTTQQNAALVEQSSAAASSLHDQAESLVRSVAYFRTAAA